MAGIRRLLIICILLAPFAFANAGSNLSITVQKGDGIHTIMERYALAENACNMDSFLSLNRLGPTDYLLLDRKYRLPIMEVEYNGKSIRTTLGFDDYEKALRIQKFNEKLLEKGVKPGDFREDLKLWVPYHELYCSAEAEAKGFKPYSTTIPLMGPDHQEVTIVDERLKGYYYYLVSGHGGPDPGAMTTKDGHSLCEDEYAYDVTLRLARNLISHGATVYMIIRDENDGIRDQEFLDMDKDEICYPDKVIPLNQIARLKQRVETVNELYDKNKTVAKQQRMVAIHVDSRTTHEKIDIFFYHFKGSKTGEKLATDMLSTIKAKYAEHQKDREYRGVVHTRNLYMLRESKPATVYIELGNITNSFDQRRLLIVNNRQAIANWLALGLLTEAGK